VQGPEFKSQYGGGKKKERKECGVLYVIPDSCLFKEWMEYIQMIFGPWFTIHDNQNRKQPKYPPI
jgi:hypothetical protein